MLEQKLERLEMALRLEAVGSPGVYAVVAQHDARDGRIELGRNEGNDARNMSVVRNDRDVDPRIFLPDVERFDKLHALDGNTSSHRSRTRYC